jgi:hypothetical protein
MPLNVNWFTFWYLDGKIAAMTGPDAALIFYGEKARLAGLG